MQWLGNVAGPAGGIAARLAGDTSESEGLSRRLERLSKVFDLPRLRSESIAAQDVVTYYEHSHDAYRRYHSADGAVHMALNPGGRFDPRGFDGQLQRLERSWQASEAEPRDVLELAFGQGYNVERLAARWPGVRFAGTDLTPAHVDLAQRRITSARLSNVELELGDFESMPFADASFDALFCIEGFCHALDLPRALREAARVLRPGGRFTLFDGYLTRSPQAMQRDEALAVELVARGLAIESLQVIDELLAAARDAGFEVDAVTALDAEVMPSLERLERLTGAVIRWPWLGRRLLARRHAARGRNVISGYLMRSTVSLGLIGYRQIVLVKAAAHRANKVAST